MNKNWNILDWCAAVILGAFVAFISFMVGLLIYYERFEAFIIMISIILTWAVILSAIWAGERDL